MVLEGGILKIRLNSVPVEGKANAELIGYVAEIFGVKRSEVKILRGEKDRKKALFLPLDEARFRDLLREKARVTTG